MVTAALTDASKQISSKCRYLLSLPPEVRNRIYELVLGVGTIHIEPYTFSASVCTAAVNDNDTVRALRQGDALIEAHDAWKTRHSACTEHLAAYTMFQGPIDREEIGRHPYGVALLQTCRQVHSEAALLPFKINTFAIHWLRSLPSFLASLMRAQQRSIRAVTVYSSRFDLQPGRPHLKTRHLTGLTRLTLFEEYGHYDTHAQMKHNIIRASQMFSFAPLKQLTFCFEYQILAPYHYGFKAGLEDSKAVYEEMESAVIKVCLQSVSSVYARPFPAGIDTDGIITDLKGLPAGKADGEDAGEWSLERSCWTLHGLGCYRF